MKRLPEDLGLKKSFSPISIYFDDLEYIFEKANAQDLRTSIYDSEYEFDSLEELKEYRGQRLKFLTIKISKEEKFSNLSIQYKNGKLTLEIWPPRPEEEIKLLFYDFVRHFNLKWPLYIRMFNVLYTVWPVVIFFVGFPWALSYFSREINVVYFSLFCLTTLVFIISLILNYFLFFLYLNRRHGIDTFWKRNSDRIILLVLGAVIATIVRCFFDKFF